MKLGEINNKLQHYVKQPIREYDQWKRFYVLLTLVNVDIDSKLCTEIERLIYNRDSPVYYSVDQVITFPYTHNIRINKSRLILYKGDITKLAVDAIVNAANGDMLGCFNPTHKCIDNVIHSKAGPRLRMKCREIMMNNTKLGSIGRITPAYCLPCSYVIHVAGPIYQQDKNQTDELANCYKSSLDLIKTHELTSIAFCCISTGLYGYPKDTAAKIAIGTVINWIQNNSEYPVIVIFSVFTDDDYNIYSNILRYEFVY